MKKILVFCAVCMALVACKNPNRFILNGTLPAEEGHDTVYLVSQLDTENPYAATAKVDRETGRFTIRGIVQAPEMAILADRQKQPLGLIFIEPGMMTLERTPQGFLEIKGTPSNDAFSAFQHESTGLEGEAFASVLQTTIERNTDNLAGLYLFSESLEDWNPTAARAMAQRFATTLSDHPMMQEIQKSLTAQERTAIGAPYMEISLPGLDGTPIRLSDVAAGKWTLIDFWATWCAPCRAEMPHLKEAYKKYAKRGFTIYAVSLDTDAYAWQTVVRREGFDWPNVIGISDGRSAPIIDDYAVRTIPTNYLIDPSGQIVAKNLRGTDLLQKLASLNL